jgi:hypothetical protein
MITRHFLNFCNTIRKAVVDGGPHSLMVAAWCKRQAGFHHGPGRIRDYAERREARISSTIFFASAMAGSSRAKGIVVLIPLPPEKI